MPTGFYGIMPRSTPKPIAQHVGLIVPPHRTAWVGDQCRNQGTLSWRSLLGRPSSGAVHVWVFREAGATVCLETPFHILFALLERLSRYVQVLRPSRRVGRDEAET
jgi:hypothetical protein